MRKSDSQKGRIIPSRPAPTLEERKALWIRLHVEQYKKNDITAKELLKSVAKRIAEWIAFDPKSDPAQWAAANPEQWELITSGRGMVIDTTTMPDSVASAMVEPIRHAFHETEDEMFQRHDQEYEDVHNGSGLSEEMPSDLRARHRDEHEALLRRLKKSAKRPHP